MALIEGAVTAGKDMVGALGAEMDRLESEIKRVMPGIRHIDLVRILAGTHCCTIGPIYVSAPRPCHRDGECICMCRHTRRQGHSKVDCHMESTCAVPLCVQHACAECTYCWLVAVRVPCLHAC